jgi:hypothetical protein
MFHSLYPEEGGNVLPRNTFVHLAEKCRAITDIIILKKSENLRKQDPELQIIKQHNISETSFFLWAFDTIQGHDFPLPGFTITHSDTSHSVGILWTSDQPVTETST